MTRRISPLVFVAALAGLCLTGIACGGSKTEDQPSNAPVGKPAEGQSGPVAAGLTNEGGSSKVNEESVKVPRKTP